MVSMPGQTIQIKLDNGECRLIFEWDNWTEGSIEGPAKETAKLASKNNLTVTNEWRWADYDENH